MKILVTGGAGYVGSHTAHHLRKLGHDVVIYDNLCTGFPGLVSGFELIEGDILDPSRIRAAVSGVDAVFHFAAHAYVEESVRHPRKYFRNNLEGGLSLLNAIVDSPVRKIIFSSTCTVYGRPAETPISEDTPRVPLNPYGMSKLALEQALEAYATAYGLTYVSLRYFNAAGADEEGLTGELHNPETHLIPCAMQAVLGVRPALEIFGEDYPTPDGTCIRDYVHVNDLACAHARALQYLNSGGASCALNLGGGRGHSVKQVVGAIAQLTGRTVPIRYGPRRPGDAAVLVADPSQARRVLDWEAKRSLSQILSSAWNWMQSRRRQSNRCL